MNNNEGVIQKKFPSRRKFVWGMGVLSMFAAIAALVKPPFQRKRDVIACEPEGKKRMIRMLSQDGTLVEIDESLITAGRKKISNSELQDWIKK
jgi:hypothetical protein